MATKINYSDGGLKNVQEKITMYTEFHCATTVVDSIVTRLNSPRNANLHYRFAFTAQKETIADRWRKAFYRVVSYHVKALGGDLVCIDGSNRTLNLRVILPPTAAPDIFARRLKILSASWARRKAACSKFAWREDYEAITLDSTRLPQQNMQAKALRASV